MSGAIATSQKEIPAAPPASEILNGLNESLFSPGAVIASNKNSYVMKNTPQGGVCLVASGHPLDLIKVRLQTQADPNSLPAGPWIAF